MGITLADTMPDLLVRAGVAQVKLVKFSRKSSLRGGDISVEAKALTGAARAEYRARGFGFWDFLLSGAVSASTETQRSIFERAAVHGESDNKIEILTIQEMSRRLVEGDYADLPSRDVVSLSSNVKAGSSLQEMHVPMLDFSIKSLLDNDATVVNLLQSLNLGGNLYESGSSYHYYGSTLVSQAELWKILGRAQLLGPLVDHRWISHQIIDGECALRISTDATRHVSEHRLVATSMN